MTSLPRRVGTAAQPAGACVIVDMQSGSGFMPLRMCLEPGSPVTSARLILAPQTGYPEPRGFTASRRPAEALWSPRSRPLRSRGQATATARAQRRRGATALMLPPTAVPSTRCAARSKLRRFRPPWRAARQRREAGAQHRPQVLQVGPWQALRADRLPSRPSLSHCVVR